MFERLISRGTLMTVAVLIVSVIGLMAALRILQRGDTTPERLVGSWAGAMGHTQFIPTSYLAYAVDFTGDGKRDIWSDDPTDALASTAAYLKRFGWTSRPQFGLGELAPAETLDDLRAANRDVLAHFLHEPGARFFDRAPVAERLCGQLSDVGLATGERGPGNSLGKRYKVLVLGDEIGFRIDLDDNRLAAILLDHDAAIRSHATSFLVGLGRPGLAQRLRSRIEVTVRFNECLLALHHAGAGALAEFLHHGCTDRHRFFL